MPAKWPSTHSRYVAAQAGKCQMLGSQNERRKMVSKKTWEQFRKTGLLWFVNTILHMFGWAIVYEIDNGKILHVYPAGVKFRGFAERDNSEGYAKVTEFLQENINDLSKGAKS